MGALDLYFEGDLSVWFGAALALVSAIAIFRLYRRETGQHSGLAALLLPLLRSLAVALIILMLTGPVLRGSVTVGDMSRVLIFVDGSKSMSLTDETMSVERKLLNARRLGWLEDEEMDTALYDAAQVLVLIRDPVDEINDEELVRVYLRHAYGAVDVLPDEEVYRDRVSRRLVDRLETIRAQVSARDLTPIRLRSELDEVRAVAKSLRQQLQSEYRKRAAEVSPSDASPDSISGRLDALTRWKRAESAMLTESDAVLPNLVGDHQVDLFAFSTGDADGKLRRLWQPAAPDDLPETFELAGPVGSETDLVSQVDSFISELPRSERLAVVMMSDGQHNLDSKGRYAGSPLQVARLLGRRGVPIYAVGFGAESPPADLAVLAVQTPETVFADDRIKGDVLVKDRMPADLPFQVKIEIDGRVVWSEELRTDGSAIRTVGFDFAIKDLVEDRIGGEIRETDSVSLPLALQVSIDPIEGEIRDDNNSRETNVRAITGRRRALIVDSRPRWEFRYLRNLLDRDEHWEVNAVLTNHELGRPILPRGDQSEAFPSDRKQLFTYDLIVLGDVSASVFQDQELEWMNQFVAGRGGGLVLIDGQRGKLRSLSQSALRVALPVRWTAPHSEGLREVGLSLTESGRATAAFAFDGDGDRSHALWSQLPRLRWLAPVEALPGCEVLLRGISINGSARPAVVTRRYGAGTVVYCGFDDTWRWRYEVADQFHAQYWNQVATFTMESPFAVHDRLVSIDTGGFSYQPGEAADLKVRLRDEEGRPVVDVQADAVLYQDDEIVATVPLQGGLESGGVLRGTTQPLQAGTYQVGVKAEGYDDESLAVRAEFVVDGDEGGELGVLYCNEPLLQQMAELSGGQYLREEDVGRLPELLASQADRKEETTEISLWRSWYWFLPLLGLFSLEWLLRKRMGLM